MTSKTISFKFIFVSIFLILTACACKTRKPTVVGVWKPKELILTENQRKDTNNAMFINMTFEKSKEIYYKFNENGTFEFISDKDIPGLKDAKGTYSVKGTTMTINYNNTKQESEIIKLTDTEMQGQSQDSLIVIYEKLRDK